MPTPQPNENRDDFIGRCVPMVLDEGIAEDNAQAVAICGSMFDDSKRGKNMTRERKTVDAIITDIDEEQGIVEAVFAVTGNIDQGNDRIKAGAFTKTISERGHQVLVLDQHRTDSTKAAVARTVSLREIGRNELPPETQAKFPDATGGAKIRSQWMLDDPDSAAIFRRIKNGIITQWSFAYDALDTSHTQEEKDGQNIIVRDIGTIKLFEVSPVLFGMNEATSTTFAKSAQDKAFPPMIVGLKAFNLSQRVDKTIRSFYTQYPDSRQIVYWVKQVWDEFIIVEQVGAINKLWQISYQMSESDLAFAPVGEWQEVEVTFSAVEVGKSGGAQLEQKAGRAISARNEARMRAIIDSVQQQLAQLEAILPSAQEEQQESETEENSKQIDLVIPPGTKGDTYDGSVSSERIYKVLEEARKRELGQYVLDTFNRMVEIPSVKSAGYENAPDAMRDAIIEEYGLEQQTKETTQHDSEAGPGDTPPTNEPPPLVDIDSMLKSTFEEVQ